MGGRLGGFQSVLVCELPRYDLQLAECSNSTSASHGNNTTSVPRWSIEGLVRVIIGVLRITNSDQLTTVMQNSISIVNDLYNTVRSS